MTSATGQTKTNSARRGMTLIELVLVMTLTLVLLAMAAPRLNAFSRGQVLRSNAEQVLALLRTARDRAVAQAVTCRVTIDTDARTLTLKTVNETDPETETNDETELELTENITLTVATPKGEPLEQIDFTATGATTPATITLTGSNGQVMYVFARTAQETFAITDEETETEP